MSETSTPHELSLPPLTKSTMTTTRNKQKIVEAINDLSDSEKVSLNNTFCEVESRSDDMIYDNDEEFFETFFGGKVIEAVRAISYGEYTYTHDWIKFDGYGNLESMGYIDDDTLADSIENIADSIFENPKDYQHIIDLDDLELEDETVSILNQ